MADAEHPHVALLRSVYEALGGRDLDAVGNVIAQDAFAVVGGNNALSGTHRGGSQVLGLFATILEHGSDLLELDVHDVLANDDHGLAIVRVTAEGDGGRYDDYETHVYELADGWITGLFIYWTDPAPADEFFVG